MASIESPVREIYLQPGESQLVSEPAVIRTILGSCVGVTFRHARLGLSGMCHPMLPTCSQERRAQQEVEINRKFVDFTIQEMAQRLDALGAPRHEVEIKLFGGADVLPVSQSSTKPTVGRLNCEAALATLESEGFHIAASSLGGKSGVNIRLDSRTGEVLLRRLS